LQLEDILNKIQDGILIADCQRLNLYYANDAICRMLGIEREKLLRLSIPDIHPQEALPKVLAAIERQKAGEPPAKDIPVKCSDGQIIYADINTSLIEYDDKECILGVFHDITSRKKLEIELALKQDTERHFSKLLEQLAEVILELTKTSSLDELCRATVELGMKKLDFDRLSVWFLTENAHVIQGSFGVDPQGNIADERQERFSISFDDVIQPVIEGKQPILLCPDAPLFFGGACVGRGQRITASLWDGEKIIGFMSVDNLIRQRPFSHHDTEVIRLFALAVGHLSTQRRIAEANRLLQEELFQAQKMDSVGRLAGGIAHEFNNMLGVIIGHAEMAQENIAPTSHLAEDLNQILNAARRSALLVNQLLSFARKQIIHPQLLNIDRILSNSLPMLQKLLGEGINISFEPGSGAALIRIDPIQFEQALANLLTNARDAIDAKGEKGEVRIKSERINLASDIRTIYDVIPAGEYVLLTVTDTGCGMTDDVKRHLFEPFFSTKKTNFKAGLGLATVFGIVKQSDGFILVESQEGEGTSFKILFPPVLEADQTPPFQPESDNKIKTQKLILVVEDESMVLDITREALERKGYRVLACASSSEAIKIAEEHRNEIELLLTDVVMQDLSGPELAKRLKLFAPKLKVLYISGYSFEILQTKEVTEDNFLAKPFSISELLSKVKSLL